MKLAFPTLKLTLPLILLGFAATLCAVNLLYHVPQAERAAEDDTRKRLVQELSRLQSSLEYLLLRGDVDVAQHEVAVLAHNHDAVFAALVDDRQTVIASTRRAWLQRPIADVLPEFDLNQAAGAIRARRGDVNADATGQTLLGYAGILMNPDSEELRPSRVGSLLLAYDLHRYKAEARARVVQQSLLWTGWVTALAFAMWLVFHFLLTRRTARLVHAAEEFASGNLDARSGLKGPDELGRLGSAFDAMARKIAQDFAEKKRAAEEVVRQRESLHQREKLAALGSLLAGVAHELNNPLSVVVARAVLLEEQGDPKTQAAAFKIRTAAERCARIVRTFLAMARQQQPERGPVAINGVVTAALDIAGYALRTSSIDVGLDLAKDVPLIQADGDQLHQVLLNLIINAQQSLQDHAPPRRISIASRFDAASGVVTVTVADNGPGIPQDVRARIFEPYFTTKPMGTGTGVGLAVSLGIVEAHGGTLTVASPPDGGAVFTIALPVGHVSTSDTDETQPGYMAVRRRAILVVDDESEIREALAEILSQAKHRVVTANSGREALARMADERYDVIFTDMRMPDLDGRALYQEIERRWPEQAARVVFVTGDTLATALREFVSGSGRPVIEKPFLPSDVRRIVVEVTTDGDARPGE